MIGSQTCPKCGQVVYNLPMQRHQKSPTCLHTAATRALEDRGLARFTVALTSAGWSARLRGLGVLVEVHCERPLSGNKGVEYVWAESWAVRIFEAEPVLPNARESALEQALTDHTLRLAILGAYALGGRKAVAHLVQETFG